MKNAFLELRHFSPQRVDDHLVIYPYDCEFIQQIERRSIPRLKLLFEVRSLDLFVSIILSLVILNVKGQIHSFLLNYT